jgi:2-phospho-L-lactate/phosphoenolpyruvate guanylyltransferase
MERLTGIPFSMRAAHDSRLSPGRPQAYWSAGATTMRDMREDGPARALEPLHAVVPVRTLSGSKARLGLALDAEEREELVLGLLRRTLAVLGAWAPARTVHLVSPDATLLGAVATHPRVRRQTQAGEGLNAGIRQARDAAAREGAASLLVMPIDLPLLSVEALERLLTAADATLAAAHGGPLVVIAPADARGGTNALLLSPVDVIEPAFGPDSLAAHVRAAAGVGAAVQLVADPELGFDLDTPDDLERLDPARLRELVALGSDALSMAEP